MREFTKALLGCFAMVLTTGVLNNVAPICPAIFYQPKRPK